MRRYLLPGEQQRNNWGPWQSSFAISGLSGGIPEANSVIPHQHSTSWRGNFCPFRWRLLVYLHVALTTLMVLNIILGVSRRLLFNRAQSPKSRVKVIINLMRSSSITSFLPLSVSFFALPFHSVIFFCLIFLFMFILFYCPYPYFVNYALAMLPCFRHGP